MKMVGDNVSEYWGWGFYGNSSLSGARAFAIKAHGDQKRKYTGEPYWKHLEEVAALAGSYYKCVELETAGWLHDVLEDTPTTLEDVHWNFGARVAYIVDWLTDKYTKANYPSLNRAERKRLERDRFKNAPAEAKIVKLADLLSNTRSILQNDPEFSLVYLEEKRLILDECMQNMKDHPLYSRAMAAVN